MIDSGATGLFIDKSFVRKHQMTLIPLKHPIRLHNIDGSNNTAGQITHFVRLHMTLGKYHEWTDFLVTNLGTDTLILGLPWLRKVNPAIDWKTGTFFIPRKAHNPSKVQVEEVEDEEIQATRERSKLSSDSPYIMEEMDPNPSTAKTEEILTTEPNPIPPQPDEEPPPCRIRANRATRRAFLKAGILESTGEELWCMAGYTYSQQIAEKGNKAKQVKTLEEMVPEEYRRHVKVFSEQESERLPEHKPWDHAIDLLPGAPETMRTKIYPMSINEQAELDKFLAESLRKKYIQPSKSPIASPVFFIKKKDGKLRLVQDYRKLNEWTVKNRYPLPLVSDIVNRLRNAKYFTKFDVRWGYHNVRIKKGDEWKAAFATNSGLFEPLVMLFGLTNSPATFQSLMNTIFADLIAEGKVAVYLDDILIFTSDLTEHRSVTHEVLNRLEKYDLYL